MEKKHKEKIKKSVKKNWGNLDSSARKKRCENMSKADKGKPSPHKGKKFPSLIGNTNGFKKGNVPWNKGKGNKSLAQRIRSSLKYKQWRSDVFQRDGWTCQTCGALGCKLEAHHKKKLSQILKDNNIKTIEEAMNCKELWDINNGVTLCKPCHDLTKTGEKK
jgi:hypothetical protein